MKAPAIALLTIGLELAGPVAFRDQLSARAELLVRIDPENRSRLEGGERGGGRWQLFQTPRGTLVDARVSPRERYVAVLRAYDGVWGADGWATRPRNDFVLLSRSGRIVCEIDRDVRRFVFSPDASHLAYIVGEHFDGGIGFEPRAVEALEISTCKNRLIPLDERLAPYELHWIQTGDENAILIRVLGDPEVRQVRVDWRGDGSPKEDRSGAFHLSPDGQFFYRLPSETILSGDCRLGRGGESCLEVRSRAGTTETVAALSDAKLGRAHGWVGGEGHQLLFSRRTFADRPPTVDEPEPERVLEQVHSVILDVGRENPTENPLAELPGFLSRGAALGDWSCCAAHVVYWPVGVSAEDALRRGLALWPPEPPRPRRDPGRLLDLGETLDFESDAHGRRLPPGEILAEQWTPMGVHVTARGRYGAVPMIFDSADPTGGDPDLGTPNREFGGPGVGTGGARGAEGENDQAQDNILVLGLPSWTEDPGDSSYGGVIEIGFERPVELAEVHLVDIDNELEAGQVVAYDGGGVEIARARMQPLGDNSFQRLPLAAAGVRRLEILFPASGALAALRFVPRDTSALTALTRGWAAAWSEKRTDDYLAYYSERFTPAWRMKLDEWRTWRRERISRPRSIRLELGDLDAWFTGSDTASVRFEQMYEADHFQDRVTKVLDLELEGDDWKIVGEWVLE